MVSVWSMMMEKADVVYVEIDGAEHMDPLNIPPPDRTALRIKETDLDNCWIATVSQNGYYHRVPNTPDE